MSGDLLQKFGQKLPLKIGLRKVETQKQIVVLRAAMMSSALFAMQNFFCRTHRPHVQEAFTSPKQCWQLRDHGSCPYHPHLRHIEIGAC